MSAAKWEDRYRKQLTANNLLSDKLRRTREVGQKMIDTLKMAYAEKVAEVGELNKKVALLEVALNSTIPELKDEIPDEIKAV